MRRQAAKKANPKTRIQVADSVASAASITGYSADVLRIAKANGCQAFVNGRVHIARLVKFVTSNPKLFKNVGELPSKELLDRKLKQARLIEQDLINAKLSEKFIDREEHNRILATIARTEWPKRRNFNERTLPQALNAKCVELGVTDETRTALVAYAVAQGIAFTDQIESEMKKIACMK